jgi:hypothetical protein
VTANDNVVRDNASMVPSPLSLSPVFQNKMLLNLKQFVKVIYPGDATDDVLQQCIMQLNGIPPQDVQLAQLKQLQQSVASMKPTILEWVEQMLDDRTINGTLSGTRMRSLMVSVMEEGQSQLRWKFAVQGSFSVE